MLPAMPDLFQSLAHASDDFVAMVGDVLERRAADPAQQAILEACLDRLAVPSGGAAALEIGCGTGPVCRRLAAVDGIARVRGIDPAPGLIDRARLLAADLPGVDFVVAPGEASGEATGSYDIVVLYTVLSHVAEPAALLAEAYRVLKPGGMLAVCDSDFSKATAAVGPADPLQACIEAWAGEAVTDRWLVPKLPGLLEAAGFAVAGLRGHHRVDVSGVGSGSAWIDYGIDVLVESGRIGAVLGEALRAESRRRVGAGRFFAAIPFVTLQAIKVEAAERPIDAA